MARLRRFSVAFAALMTVSGMLTPLPAAIATAEVHGPFGLLCGFTSFTDPQVEGAQTGEVDAGPLVVTDLATGLPDPTGRATVRCTLQTGLNDTHSEADAASLTSGGAGAVALAAGLVTYEAGGDEDVYLCTQVNYANGPTLFFDVVTGDWSTSSTAACDLAIGAEFPDPGPLNDVDPFLCPPLALVFPPEGDIPGFWDCPPYDSFRGPDGPDGSDNGKGYLNRRRKDPDADPDPAPAPPYFPKATVSITGNANGQVMYSYTGFTPARAQWTCVEGPASITCTPPPAPSGYTNVCYRVTVAATNQGTGAVTGTSRCAAGTVATATSTGPTTTPSTDSATPGTVFPWHCDGRPPTGVSVQWTVTCTVGP